MPPASSVHKGTLYVVATPIGNLDDLSPRARAVLAAVDLIAAEDTRHTARLLSTIGVSVPLVSLHQHNEAQRVAILLERLRGGAAVALVSDAGTPLISDPGFNVVRAVTAEGLSVVAVPGPCAAIAALSIAGLPADRFAFEGFLPAKAASRRERLQALGAETRTLVFYEAPHRLRESLQDMASIFGAARHAVIARELTKLFESRYDGTLGDLAVRADDESNLSRGELVIVVAGCEASAPESRRDAEQTLRVLLEELPAAQAAKLAARLCGANRAELYDLAVRWKAGK